MKRTLVINLMAFAGAAALSGAVYAQAQPAPAPANSIASAAPAAADFKAGAQVRDSKGVQVATVVSTEDGNVVLDTGQTKIGVPPNLFTKTSEGLALTVTADQFNAAVAKAHARSEAAKAQAQAQGDPKPQ